MELSPEDNLRLNVLLKQALKAVRIDESRMVVYALSDRGEAKVPLNPNCADEKYLRQVRELLSTHTMGSPGGYPVYIKRWTRMGQDRREQSLEQLLLLGEPEAVVAVVHAPGLSVQTAAHAWWAYPSADNARRLLEKPQIAGSDLAREMAAYLIEFLPFEIEAQAMIDSVRLCLQPGLISAAEREKLWARAKRKQAFYVGFLYALPDELPEQKQEHPVWCDCEQALQEALSEENPYALKLKRLMSAPGQSYLQTVLSVIDKASSQDMVVSLFKALQSYFSVLPLQQQPQRTIELVEQQVQEQFTDADETLAAVIKALPEHQLEMLKAMLVLAHQGESSLNHIFGQTDALGSVMRKKLKPLTQPLTQYIQCLKA